VLGAEGERRRPPISFMSGFESRAPFEGERRRPPGKETGKLA
jgi:hypothetical protein